ncbi:MAG: hypothetical protein E7500_07530 [Ruminococcus sp.]|nr:hypothetical protein [Ruminococcus sp.]
MFDNNDENYNGDYIRPSEEYRADCGVEHGMTYENHDDEQHAYDAHNSAESMFTSMLMSGERILWAGSGKGGGAGTAVGVIFASFWLGFAFLWTIGATVAGGAFGLFGIPFIVIGITVFAGILFPSKKYYAITNMRVLRKEGKNMVSERLDQVTDVTVTVKGSGKGDVTYRSTGNTFYRNSSQNINAMRGFFNVENPNEVYRTLNEAIHMATYLN